MDKTVIREYSFIRVLGITCLVIGVLLVGFVWYVQSGKSAITRPFSSYSILSSSWEMYKKKFITADGRVIDMSSGDITTSEGQSYALLRAVWSDDKTTFDMVWKWTKTTLKRPNDNLFSWRWGKTDAGYGVTPNGGINSATDADSDIAFALILANHRWRQDQYLIDAKVILNDIWNGETAEIGGKRYMIAGNWATDANQIIINPSYFAPYEYRIFAKVDQTHDWAALVNPGYELLETTSNSPLDKPRSAGLPPDWIAVNKQTGGVTAAPNANLTTNYGYDAVRVPFRVGLDYIWNKDERAKKYLDTSFQILAQEYIKNGKLSGVYAHDGGVVESNESPTLYATLLGYALVSNPDLSKRIYQEKILSLYTNDTNAFREDIPYYEQNWLWFGAALYNNALIPL